MKKKFKYFFVVVDSFIVFFDSREREKYNLYFRFHESFNLNSSLEK